MTIENGTVKLSGGDQVLRTSTSIRDHPDREEKGHLSSPADDGEARNDFWSISGNYISKKNEGRVVVRGDIAQDGSGSDAVFTEQGSSASQMTAAKVMDIISRQPGCAGQTADAVSAYSKSKWKMHRVFLLTRLISSFHNTSQYKQYCHVGNSAQQCGLGLFQDCDFAEILKTQNRLQEDFCAYLEVTRLFPQVGCVRNGTSVSHSSMEAQILSLDAGLRMDGSPALDLWDFVIEVLHSSSNQPENSKKNVQGNLLRDTPSRKQTENKVKTPIQHNDLELCNVHNFSSNVKSSQSGAVLYVFEDDEAVVKMIIKGRSPNNETRIPDQQCWA